ncbi:hypothetical protein [Psychroflexus aestuariivivens]|uniref:hypothetical protein n=1 Tax=Psychroflexus aestuariivivens TaxID=1795040 RepID=UPI001300A2A6|nr:hypothetical protein [Psychroflexus aestuariivivens]
MKAKEKKQLLIHCIELHVQCGYSIEQFIGKPVSYFDMDKIQNRVEWLKNEFQIEGL